MPRLVRIKYLRLTFRVSGSKKASERTRVCEKPELNKPVRSSRRIGLSWPGYSACNAHISCIGTAECVSHPKEKCMKKSDIKKFVFHFLNKSVHTGEGKNVAEAFTNAGFNSKNLKDLSYYEETVTVIIHHQNRSGFPVIA